MVFHHRIPAGQRTAPLRLWSRWEVTQGSFRSEASTRDERDLGLSNLILATIIASGLAVLDLYSDYALAALLIGFWLIVLMFGTGIRRFLSEPQGTVAR